MITEEIKNELRRGLVLTKLQRGLALTVRESRDLYKYIEALEQRPCDNCIIRKEAAIDLVADMSEESKNREFQILIKDTETYIKVTKQMDKEGIRWVSDGKLASNSEKYKQIHKYFPIYLCVDKYNRLSWTHPNLFDEGFGEITPEEYLKNIK